MIVERKVEYWIEWRNLPSSTWANLGMAWQRWGNYVFSSEVGAWDRLRNAVMADTRVDIEWRVVRSVVLKHINPVSRVYKKDGTLNGEEMQALRARGEA